jgi:glycosyltransferase involved in cell wall biosynthesis
VGNDPGPATVPVSVVVLTRDEERNIRNCLASVAWAKQVVVIDSGSTDDTIAIARSLGVKVIEQPWLGFSDQREFALRHPAVKYDWVYFVDADQWISQPLAAEVAARVTETECAAFSQRLRLVFQGRWIRHCGWYSGSWNVQLMDKRYSKYDGNILGERVCVDGPIDPLAGDIVDDDGKGLAEWLHKHVRYAQLEAECRGRPFPLRQRIRALQSSTRGNSRPAARAVLKDVIFPSVPAKPVALFLYMYLVRLGVLDGRAGLRFCFYHAWYETTVSALQGKALASD